MLFMDGPLPTACTLLIRVFKTCASLQSPLFSTFPPTEEEGGEALRHFGPAGPGSSNKEEDAGREEEGGKPGGQAGSLPRPGSPSC